jgi:hypothetical protein
MADEPTAPDRREPTPDEMAVAFSGPAPAANRFFVTIGHPGVRIAFAEEEPGSGRVHFRSAVSLHPVDAIGLRKLLQLMLADLEPLVEGPSDHG